MNVIGNLVLFCYLHIKKPKINKVSVKLRLNRKIKNKNKKHCCKVSVKKKRMLPMGAIARKLNPLDNIEHKTISELPL